MFLLIRMVAVKFSVLRYQFTFQYVSINTPPLAQGTWMGWQFTFQYVSINTATTSRDIYR